MDLQLFLDQAAELRQTNRFQRLQRLGSYYRGTQYVDRPLDMSGMRKDLPGVPGSMTHSPPMSQRDPGAVWNLVAEVVEELTAWSVGGTSWCALDVPGDEQTEQWLHAVCEQCGLPDVVADARDVGGAQGTSIVSVSVLDGEFFLEVHEPEITWAVEWASEVKHVPSVVAKVYERDDEFLKPREQKPLVARVWTTTDERWYERVKNRLGEWSWQQTNRAVHGFNFCPVVWFPQFAKLGSHDGVPDLEEPVLSLVDGANYLFGAAQTTTCRNADDTLVIHEDPSLSQKVYKGALRAIWARGGAEYLSQSGDSAKICMELGDKRAKQAYRRAKVVSPSPEDLARATTGEALKRLFQPQIKQAGRIRRAYQKGLIEPLLRMMISVGKQLGQGIVLQPKERRDEKLGVAVIEVPTLPPKPVEHICCHWPDPFPPSIADQAQAVTLAGTATGGKQVLSQETAVRVLASVGLPIGNVDEELERIEHDAEEAAEVAAKALGMGEIPPGKAGPMGEEESDDAEEDDTEAEVEA